jgi:ElaB/YqjD/DUF883 family membrane-anchored ribosome-binding protein
MPKENNNSISYVDHLLALREADKELSKERDLRYSQVDEAREKAVRVKEEAQKEALELARREQEYKDNKASELRDKFGAASGSYVTRDELSDVVDTINSNFKTAIDPITKYISEQQGKSHGISMSIGMMVGIITVVSGAIALLGFFIDNIILHK